MIFELAVVLGLILLNGFFAMSEMAIVSSRRARLQSLAERGDSGAKQALALTADPSRFLSAVQIGITLIGILAGAFSGATLGAKLGQWLNTLPLIAPYGETAGFAIVVVILTFVSLVLGELVPKRVALASPEPIAARVARPLGLVATACKPFVLLLGASTSFVLRLLGVRREGAQAVTEEEVKTVLAEGAEAGAITAAEKDMLEGVLRLADKPVRSIMTPRPDVWWIDIDDPPSVIGAEVRQCPWSRLVVARGGSVEEPIGVVQKKDLLDAMLDGRPLDIRGALRQPPFVPDGSSILDTLQTFKSQPLPMAFIVDEYGSFEGVVTLTDVLAAIAGEMGEEEGRPAPGIRTREDGSLLVDGRCSLIDLVRATGISLGSEERFHTVAGLVLHLFRTLPREGQTTTVEGWKIEVVDLDGPRIDKVLLSRLEAGGAEANGAVG